MGTIDVWMVLGALYLAMGLGVGLSAYLVIAERHRRLEALIVATLVGVFWGPLLVLGAVVRL